MISNRCARKSLVTNCNSIISKNYLRFLVDSNDIIYKVKLPKSIQFCFSTVQYLLSTVQKQQY